jgi:glycosyltransferase involved in cell wall biosynthesis
MKVALVHDWLTGMRGGEKVLERFALMYPEAPIYTLIHEPGSVSSELESHRIETSFVQRLPARRQAYRWYLPLFPAAVRGLDLSDVHLVLSSSHCAVKAVRTRADALHLCYCHTPMRYAWDRFDEYFSPRQVGWPRHLLIRPTIAALRWWDRATAPRVDGFIANSGYVRERIQQYYDRSSTVISPPVDTTRFRPGRTQADYYLMVSALSPYKRVATAIEAFNTMGRRLLIVGEGPERDRLQAMAGPSVELLGRADEDALLDLYQKSRGFILPGVEDAGIAPIEAMACGRPALVLNAGGAPEAVVDGETGLYMADTGAPGIIEAVDTAEGLTFNTEAIRAHAEHYSVSNFDQRVTSFIQREVSARQA